MVLGGWSDEKLLSNKLIRMPFSTDKFGILNFGHCDFFDICDLIFLTAEV